LSTATVAPEHFPATSASPVPGTTLMTSWFVSPVDGSQVKSTPDERASTISWTITAGAISVSVSSRCRR
jgi:hypothetical protein